MKVCEIYNAIDSFAPFKYKEKWDNCGILIGNPQQEVKKAILVLDITDEVINKAISEKIQLIITHHPIIFEPLKSVTVDSKVYKLIRGNISVISAHTNLDVSKIGVNKALADAVKLINLTPLLTTKELNSYLITTFVPEENAEDLRQALSNAGAGTIGEYSNCSFSTNGEGRFTPLSNTNPHIGTANTMEILKECRIEVVCKNADLNNVISALKSSHPYETPAYYVCENISYKDTVSLGYIGELPKVCMARELALEIKSVLNAGTIRLTNPNMYVKKVAVCGGAGSDTIETAISKGADALLTGDLKHNNMIDSLHSGIVLIDAGHFPTENIVLNSLNDTLTTLCKGVEFISCADMDPCLYL